VAGAVVGPRASVFPRPVDDVTSPGISGRAGGAGRRTDDGVRTEAVDGNWPNLRSRTRSIIFSRSTRLMLTAIVVGLNRRPIIR
jgi:hypothetical protein